MNILLSRHGNTFSQGDPVVWAGTRNDLPLVESGLAQAERLAAALIEQKIEPGAVYCSPLQRTSAYARLIIKRLGLSIDPIVDSRLNEIDYGDWTGLTQKQVIEKFGEDAFKAWEERSEWPVTSSGRWGGSVSQIIREVESFTKEIIRRHPVDETVLVVTSNGRLRYFLTLIEGEFERRARSGTFKVKTGNICKLTYVKGIFSLSYWNETPGPQLKI